MRNRSIKEFGAQSDYEKGLGPKPDSPYSFGRHTRKCAVCNHPDRDAIEQEFLRWYAPQDIARDHDIPYASSIYRHAHATGLFERRRATIRLALEPLIEQATGVEATADSVVKAIRTYAQLNDAGQWVNAPSHVVHHVVQVAPGGPAPLYPEERRAPLPHPSAQLASHPEERTASEIQIPNREI
jgi:hypothetical protein